MDASVATEIERAFAQAGHVVVSNSKNHRMEPDVPLLVPEVNPDHLKLVPSQQRHRGWKGQIVTNPNCSTVVLTMALGPLKPFGITRVITTTLQAISGAGYPGVASMDIIANVIPFIGGEEEKMQQETQKILGDFRGDHIEPLPAKVSAHCNRVPVVDGHTVTVSVEFSAKPSEADLRHAFDPLHRRAAAAPPSQRAAAPGHLHGREGPPAAAPRCRARKRHGGVHRPSAPLPGARLQVRRPGPQHRARRGGRGRAQCRADAFGRNARLMIVMKFGGTSVESAAAIERVASIVKARASRRPVVVVSAMGKTTNKLLAIAAAAIDGAREEYIRQIHDLRDFHSREARLVVPLADRAELDRLLDEHFQELTELVKGLAVLGELTPRSIDAISSYGERLSSYIVALAFRHFGMDTAHLDSRQVIVTDRRHTQAAPLFPETYARLAAVVSALLAGKQDRGDGRLHRRHRRMASPPRSAAAVRISPPLSWARASAPKRSRSGPTWTACSPPIPPSCPAAIA